MNFNDIQMINTLGTGVYGTTYLVKYNNNNYALKIQHILPNDKNESYKKGLWRELDLYDYINTLQPFQQKFFTKLYGYEIINDCNHKQKRPSKINLDVKLLNLDKSKWCVKFLTEYKGKKTLRQYLSNNTLTINQTYSIILQICNIMLILYDGGYSHNDLHEGNIMLNFTEEKTFMFKNNKIPYHGLQISAIDYGEVLHKKFKINYKDYYTKDFLENRKAFLFNELYYNIIYIMINYFHYVNDCKKMKQKLPWKYKIDPYDNLIKILINDHPDFFTEAKNKYVKLYPKSTVLINDVEKNIYKFTIKEMVRDKKNEYYFWKVMDRIAIEFRILHPKLYSEYYKWCSYHKCNLPKQDILDIMLMTNVDELFNYLINKII